MSAPNIEGNDLKLPIKNFDWGGGSSSLITNQVYGLFLSNNKEYIVFLGKKEPEKFIKEYKEAKVFTAF